jgi:stage III sporulation protein AH
MNKKQAGIIVTLLALIVCAGLLAARVNGPLEVTNDGYDPGSSVFKWNQDKNTSKTELFTSVRTDRDLRDTQTIAQYKQIIDDKNLSDTNKAEAIAQYNLKTKQMDQEGRIEAALKLKGFEDVICLIENDNTKVRVIVKAKELTEQQRKQIKDVVVSTAKITNVEISLNQK